VRLNAKCMMTSVMRARERGEMQGFMKVVVDAATERVLGAAILGLCGDEIVHTILDVMAAGAPYAAISRTMHIRPTVAEYLPTLFGDLEPLV
jgi:pyruvate/2-oxoglutarate dehydrogenase complex dihydrolipoamide dehydrogenase (E3) component